MVETKEGKEWKKINKTRGGKSGEQISETKEEIIMKQKEENKLNKERKGVGENATKWGKNGGQ